MKPDIQSSLESAGVEALPSSLAALSARILQSTLIEAHAQRADGLTPQDVLKQYEDNAFVVPCEIDQREVIRFDAFVANKVPSHFDMLELSPVTALGANSVLSPISQRTVLGTIRNTEVVADATTALTLEIAKRKRTAATDAPTTYHLGSLHRELRTQQHAQPGFTTHFGALSLVSASRTDAPDEFKASTFAEHAKTYVTTIQDAKEIGYETNQVTVALSNIRIAELLIKHKGLNRHEVQRNTQTPGFNLFEAYDIDLPTQIRMDEIQPFIDALPDEYAFLRRAIAHTAKIFEGVTAEMSLLGSGVVTYFDLARHAGVGYYEDACVKISAENAVGELYPLVDIGSCDWSAKLLNNKHERLITGGMGTELFMKKFKGSQAK